MHALSRNPRLRYLQRTGTEQDRHMGRYYLPQNIDRKCTNMIGTEVNPAMIRKGDRLANKTRNHPDGTIEVLTSRVVKRVEMCPGKPEFVHLDHECYDTRFSSVVKGVKK